MNKMDQENRLVCKRKEKGIYFNSVDDINESHMDLFLKMFNGANYKFLSKFYQSIHHINIYKYDNETYDSLIIKFRKNGIKPEDIEIDYLKQKSVSGKLTDYDKVLLYIASKKKVYLNPEEIENKIALYQNKISLYQKKIDNYKEVLKK